MKLKIFIVTIFSLCVFMLVGCSQDSGDYEIVLGGIIKEEKDEIIIEGETNLLPGSRIFGEVFVSDDELFADSTEIVDDKGRFHMELDHHQYGDAEVVVTFDLIDAQDDEIIEHYGENGEKLAGDFIYAAEGWGNAQQKAMVSLPILAGENETKHEFTAPVWEKRPDDYGDPRVWIEVDEITNDEYYFYLSGKTNLLEGTEITGHYSNKLGEIDEVRVNPDGTFNMKIEYWYSEDPYFTIGLSPYNQWHAIKEVYGHNGENLVGNDIVSANNAQELEAIIEYEHN